MRRGWRWTCCSGHGTSATFSGRQFDLDHFFEQVLRTGYTGPLSLEIFNDVFRETPNRRTATDAMRSLLLLESRARPRLLEAAAAGDRIAQAAAQRTALFDPPAVPPLSGISFIEFAVDEAAGAALEVMLQQLGFQLAGRHRSKQVKLYAQGEIRLIVNSQPDSFARTRFDLQGASVCALGLGTTEPAAAAARASALLSKRFDSPRGQHELQMPAIVAPGGSLVHFVPTGDGAPRFDEADFVPEPSVSSGGAAATDVLQAIDHLALGMPQDQLDTWVLFCRAVLGLEPADSLELADPFGLIRTSGVANAQRSVRFVLNVSLSRRTHGAHGERQRRRRRRRRAPHCVQLRRHLRSGGTFAQKRHGVRADFTQLRRSRHALRYRCRNGDAPA
jgi:4-hydroxyphenylpyruvate dioxygenase